MKKIVFVCVENSNRSQMAEAFARIHGAGKVEAFSAGSRPSGRVNPKAVEAMKELGYDLTTHTSKGLDDFNGKDFDAAVTMGCGDECPLVHAKRRVDWQIPDPRDMTAEQFGEVRNLIETKVKELIFFALRRGSHVSSHRRSCEVEIWGCRYERLVHRASGPWRLVCLDNGNCLNLAIAKRPKLNPGFFGVRESVHLEFDGFPSNVYPPQFFRFQGNRLLNDFSALRPAMKDRADRSRTSKTLEKNGFSKREFSLNFP